jgi:hypothetical protein
MLEWAGVEFGDDFTYLIQKSLKRLAIMSGATTLKFFGKIFGSQKDYWVAQGTLAFQEEQPSNRSQEKRGVGANTYVYWVANDLLKDWVQLPESVPEHLQVAQNIKVVFTGNLNAKIDSSPPFPGKERHLLREQLARITHACEICPKGLFEIDEETNEVKMAEEFEMPSTADLASLEVWGHKHPNLLNAGRCSHIAPEGMDEEAVEAFMEKVGEEDKVEERYRAIQEDTPYPGLETAWMSKVVGDSQ